MLGSNSGSIMPMILVNKRMHGTQGFSSEAWMALVANSSMIQRVSAGRQHMTLSKSINFVKYWLMKVNIFLGVLALRRLYGVLAL